MVIALIIENLILEFVLYLIICIIHIDKEIILLVLENIFKKGKYISYQAYISINNKQINLGYFDTKEWTKNKNPICWHGGLFEHKNNVLTGRYFNTCLLYEHDIDKGWMSKETIYIDCVEVEISPDNWIMSVDADNTDLLILSCNYSIQWKECSCLKGIRLEDVTVELEEEAYEEMRNNK